VSEANPAGTSADSTQAVLAKSGIHRIAISTPFPVGRVNCYLIADEPLTLIDTGPNSGTSLDELARGLGRLGHTFEDLELIVVTHQHMDHLGLLEIVARRSGAEVAALDLLAPYLEDFGASAAADSAFSMQIMRRHGVPKDLAIALGVVAASFRAFGSSAHVTRRLQHGDELVLRDRTLRALHRPGHSPTDTVFWDEQRAMLIGGDHLLAHISSNPVLSRRLDREPGAADRAGGAGTPAERPHALLDYIASMRATRELPAEIVLPGHGEPVFDHVALIDERFRMHERRARKLLRMLAPAPLSAYELATRMWGRAAVTQAFLTISEVLGHMDLLVADGRVREDDRGPVSRYVAVADAGAAVRRQ
jgi:glyoxylase-like metal-dependent hydrolase (beta-lactamase superfamily II)